MKAKSINSKTKTNSWKETLSNLKTPSGSMSPKQEEKYPPSTKHSEMRPDKNKNWEEDYNRLADSLMISEESFRIWKEIRKNLLDDSDSLVISIAKSLSMKMQLPCSVRSIKEPWSCSKTNLKNFLKPNATLCNSPRNCSSNKKIWSNPKHQFNNLRHKPKPESPNMNRTSML